MYSTALPTVIIPYPGASLDTRLTDTFVYLRPETNGVLVESTLLRVVEGSRLYKEHTQLVYLANIPGEYIVEQGIVEDHYRYKMPFTAAGGRVFTDRMKSSFERYFSESFDEGKVFGAFEALDVLHMTETELLNTRVASNDVIDINCQTVKRIGGVFVVNYDIPALLHKNNNRTDIAVMLFRSTLSMEQFRHMIEDMTLSLRSAGILEPGRTVQQVFHYSKGPFEQVLDARGHLYAPGGGHVPLSETQFCSFLRTKGILCSEVDKALDNPIMEFRTSNGEIREECLYGYTQDASYQQGYEALASSVSQYLATY